MFYFLLFSNVIVYILNKDFPNLSNLSQRQTPELEYDHEKKFNVDS